MKKYIVELTTEERSQLNRVIEAERMAAHKRHHARMLLKLDQGLEGSGWSDAKVPTAEGWLYLSAVMDLYSRRIVGWSMSANIDAELVCDALRMAVLQRQPDDGLMHHSDRGRQYTAGDFVKLLNEHKITCSMSRKGNCWDNAVMESFFGSLKTEWTFGKNYKTRAEAMQDIFKYVEVFYNRSRRHLALRYLSPEAQEQLRHKEPV